VYGLEYRADRCSTISNPLYSCYPCLLIHSMPQLVCSLTFVQYTMEVIRNTLISRMLQILLFSWKKDQSINVVNGRRLMVEILIDPKNLFIPQSARQGRLQWRSMLCKPLSLEGRLVSRLGADRKTLMRRSIIDFEDKAFSLHIQAHLVPNSDQL
jgi:hypothetical protein